VKLGLYSINGNVCALDPAGAIEIARQAERTGWESVWTAEHYLLPDPPIAASPVPPHVPMLDPFVALAHIAGHTTTLRLATGVTVLPVHEPVTLAKRVMSLDRVSGGRFLFGVGVGYLAPEFAAIGASLAARGRRSDEYLDAMYAIWSEQTPEVAGEFVRFSGLRSEPRPVQHPGPPLHVGGMSDAALQRAVQRGHGWYGYNLTVDQAAAAIERIRAAHATTERPRRLGPLEITVSPPGRQPIDAATAGAYAELGVDRLVLVPPRDALRTLPALSQFVAETPVALAGLPTGVAVGAP